MDLEGIMYTFWERSWTHVHTFSLWFPLNKSLTQKPESSGIWVTAFPAQFQYSTGTLLNLISFSEIGGNQNRRWKRLNFGLIKLRLLGLKWMLMSVSGTCLPTCSPVFNGKCDQSTDGNAVLNDTLSWCQYLSSSPSSLQVLDMPLLSSYRYWTSTILWFWHGDSTTCSSAFSQSFPGQNASSPGTPNSV